MNARRLRGLGPQGEDFSVVNTFLSALKRGATAALVITAFALALAGCGDDDKTANAGGATAAGGGGAGQTAGGGPGGKSDGDANGSSSDSRGSGGSGGSNGGSGSGSSKGSDGDSKSQKRKKSGPVIKDDNSFDSPAGNPNTGEKLSSKQRSGLGAILGSIAGAADEYVRDAFAAGWFRTDSRKINTAMNDAELAAPFIQRKLILASGATGSSQAGTLRTDLIGAFASFEALKKLKKETAGRRVARALGTLDAAIDTAREAGIEIDRSVPSRSELKRSR